MGLDLVLLPDVDISVLALVLLAGFPWGDAGCHARRVLEVLQVLVRCCHRRGGLGRPRLRGFRGVADQRVLFLQKNKHS